MSPAPTLDDVFAVISAASVGDANARVSVSDPVAEDPVTRVALALNILLDDLALRASQVEAQRAQLALAHEQNLRLGAEARLSAIVESSQDAIISKSLDGVITSWNAGAERLFGYSSTEAIGQPVAMLFPPGHEREEQDILEHLRRGESLEQLETIRRRKDGRQIDVSVTLSPVRGPAGELIGGAKVARDITAHKRAELAVRTANQELEAFSYSVAHDLRAPLRGMSGFAQVLLEDHSEKLDEAGRECLHEIHQNAVHMGTLIDALLSLSRVTRSALEVQRTDLAAVAREVLAALQAEEPRRSVQLVIADPLSAELDPSLARLLLHNLLGNAWKYSGKVAAPRIELGITARERRPVFFVRDNGAGFDMAYVGKLFAPFQRLHTVREFPGTGIGLATVQRIIHRHGGQVWAEGQVGAGATFYFTVAGDMAQESA